MSLTLEQARDEMQGLFVATWNANTPALNGGVPLTIRFQGLDTGVPPNVDLPHARIFIRHSPGAQSTFGRVGARRFTRRGLVTVQTFTPLSDRLGLSLAEKLATIARDAYEGVGTASGLWFRNVRTVEIGSDKGLFQFNTVAEFEYDELK